MTISLGRNSWLVTVSITALVLSACVAPWGNHHDKGGSTKTLNPIITLSPSAPSYTPTLTSTSNPPLTTQLNLAKVTTIGGLAIGLEGYQFSPENDVTPVMAPGMGITCGPQLVFSAATLANTATFTAQDAAGVRAFILSTTYYHPESTPPPTLNWMAGATRGCVARFEITNNTQGLMQISQVGLQVLRAASADSLHFALVDACGIAADCPASSSGGGCAYQATLSLPNGSADTAPMAPIDSGVLVGSTAVTCPSPLSIPAGSTNVFYVTIMPPQGADGNSLSGMFEVVPILKTSVGLLTLSEFKSVLVFIQQSQTTCYTVGPTGTGLVPPQPYNSNCI